MAEENGKTSQEEILDEASLDRDFVKEIMNEPGGEAIRKCFACGTCTAGCPVRRFNAKFNPRRIIRMALLGMRDEVVREPFVWLCATCFTCQERCPQGVHIAELMRALKNIAVKCGNMPEGIPMQADLLREKGTLYPLDEFDNKKRTKAGLPEMPEGHDDISPLLDELKDMGKDSEEN